MRERLDFICYINIILSNLIKIIKVSDCIKLNFKCNFNMNFNLGNNNLPQHTIIQYKIMGQHIIKLSILLMYEFKAL